MIRGPIPWYLEHHDLPGWFPRWIPSNPPSWLRHLPPPRHGTCGPIGFAWSSLLAEMDRDPCGRKVHLRFDAYLWRTAA